jgi:hypothetical protein
MPPRQSSSDRKPEPDSNTPQAPPFWIADLPLPVGPEMGAEAMPVRAFNPGDRVPAEHVERYGWQPYVHAPDGDWAVPAPAEPAAADPRESGKSGSGE